MTLRVLDVLSTILSYYSSRLVYKRLPFPFCSMQGFPLPVLRLHAAPLIVSFHTVIAEATKIVTAITPTANNDKYVDGSLKL